MSKLSNPVRKTAIGLHRFWFFINTVELWYQILGYCRKHFGKNWATAPRAKRKLIGLAWFDNRPHVPIWFDLPSEEEALMLSLKFGVLYQTNDPD